MIASFQRIRRALTRVACVLGAAAAVWGVTAELAAAQDDCRLHSRVRFNGFIERMADGEGLRRLGLFLDREVSSVSVGPGCRVTLFTGREFSGDSLEFVESVPNLPDGWKNRARSAACECGRRGRDGRRGADGGRGRDGDFDEDDGRREPPRLSRNGAACIVHEDRGFEGIWRAFERGERDRRIGRRLRERISSVQVADGCRAVLFFDRPYRLVVEGDTRRLPRGLEDRVEAVSCRCGR